MMSPPHSPQELERFNELRRKGLQWSTWSLKCRSLNRFLCGHKLPLKRLGRHIGTLDLHLPRLNEDQVQNRNLKKGTKYKINIIQNLSIANIISRCDYIVVKTTVYTFNYPAVCLLYLTRLLSTFSKRGTNESINMNVMSGPMYIQYVNRKYRWTLNQPTSVKTLHSLFILTLEFLPVCPTQAGIWLKVAAEPRGWSCQL